MPIIATSMFVQNVLPFIVAEQCAGLSSNHPADWGRFKPLAHMNGQFGFEFGHPNLWILALDMQGFS